MEGAEKGVTGKERVREEILEKRYIEGKWRMRERGKIEKGLREKKSCERNYII